MRDVCIAAALVILCGAAAPVAAQQVPPPPAVPRPAAPSAAPPALFPAGAKIAFIDFQRVADESADGKAFAARIGALIKAKQGQAEERGKQLQVNQQRLDTTGSVMSDAARAQLAKEIEKQRVDAERFQQDAQAEISELQQQTNADFQKKLAPILRELAQEKGLQMLLSRADAGIIWADPGLDLSADVVRKLDANTSQPKR
jgi:outer membrane protein